MFASRRRACRVIGSAISVSDGRPSPPAGATVSAVSSGAVLRQRPVSSAMMEAFGEGRRNLILGAAQDYEWDVLRPFVESLRATGYDGEIRFFVSGLSRETVGQLAARGVDVMRPSRARRRMAGHVFSPYNPRTTRLRWHAQPYLSRLVRLLVSVAP